MSKQNKFSKLYPGDRVINKYDSPGSIGTIQCILNDRIMIEFDEPMWPYTNNEWGIWCNREYFKVLEQ